jgi:hypothetical protein
MRLPCTPEDQFQACAAKAVVLLPTIQGLQISAKPIAITFDVGQPKVDSVVLVSNFNRGTARKQ